MLSHYIEKKTITFCALNGLPRDNWKNHGSLLFIGIDVGMHCPTEFFSCYFVLSSKGFSPLFYVLVLFLLCDILFLLHGR